MNKQTKDNGTVRRGGTVEDFEKQKSLKERTADNGKVRRGNQVEDFERPKPLAP